MHLSLDFELTNLGRSVGSAKAGCCGEEGGQSGGKEHWFLLGNCIISLSQSSFHPCLQSFKTALYKILILMSIHFSHHHKVKSSDQLNEPLLPI